MNALCLLETMNCHLMAVLHQMNSTCSLKCVLFRENKSFFSNRIGLSFQSYANTTLSSRWHNPLHISHAYTKLSFFFLIMAITEVALHFLRCLTYVLCTPCCIETATVASRLRTKLKVMIPSLFDALSFTCCQRHLLFLTLHFLFLPAL